MSNLPDIKEQIRGRELQVLSSFGISSTDLFNKHDRPIKNGLCPVCGGKDRFSFQELANGDYSFYCRSGAYGSVIDLIMHQHPGWDYKQTACEIRKVIGGHIVSVPAPERPRASPKPERDKKSVQGTLRRAWSGTEKGRQGDLLDQYLHYRGLILPAIPDVLRLHGGLGYYVETEGAEKSPFRKLGTFPAMLALVTGPDDKPKSIHRTYLSPDGKGKAKIISPYTGEFLDAKKSMSVVKGGTIRLFEPKDGVIAIAEGIETALAVYLWTGLPAWAAISAPNMKSIVLPPGIHTVHIFSDHDLPDQHGHRAGQEAAAELAKRLKQEGRTGKVHIPKKPGADYLDVYLEAMHSHVA